VTVILQTSGTIFAYATLPHRPCSNCIYERHVIKWDMSHFWLSV